MKAPRMAWNCRCFLSPVLQPEESIRDDPTFTNAADQLVPDPAIYSEWFDQADEARRKLAVGARRYAIAQQQLGGEEVLDATLGGGQQIEFTRHSAASDSDVLMWVDPRRIAPDLSQGSVPGRREDFRDFLTKGRPIQAPRVVLGKDGRPDYIDGRHRTAELIAQGANRLAVSVPKEQVEEFRKHLGAVPAKGPRRNPGWEHFLDPETGALLSATHLRTESAEARAERVAKIRAVIAQRRQETRQVATFGFA